MLIEKVREVGADESALSELDGKLVRVGMGRNNGLVLCMSRREDQTDRIVFLTPDETAEVQDTLNKGFISKANVKMETDLASVRNSLRQWAIIQEGRDDSATPDEVDTMSDSDIVRHCVAMVADKMLGVKTRRDA